MVPSRSFISKFSSSWTSHLVTVPSVPITIGITVTLMFHIFSVLWQGLGTYLSLHFLTALLRGQKRPQFSCFSYFSWPSHSLVIIIIFIILILGGGSHQR